MRYRRVITRGLLLLFAVLAFAVITACQPATPLLLSGWLNIVWYDGPPGSEIGGIEYWLTDDQGQRYQLLLDEKLAEPLGGSLALNGKRVKIVAKRGAGALQVLTIEFENP